MKIKILFITLLFLGFSAAVMAQSQEVPAAKKDAATTQTMTKSGDCSGTHTAKADCKWVDKNNDGLCDVCGSKECKDKQAAAAPKSSSAAPCPYTKECGKTTSCGAAKGSPDKK